MIDINIIDNYIDFICNIKRPITKTIINKLVPFFNYRYSISNDIKKIINISINLILIYY
jgi:hypothetical protein